MLPENVRREVGQHFVLGFHGYTVSDDIRKLIETYFVGSVIMMKRNVQDADQVRKVILELQNIARITGQDQPLLIGTDQENGLVSAFTRPGAVSQFPGAMALAATGSPELTEQVYRASGAQLRLLGVHWAYSPVADVNCDMKNPVIGVRSFGDNPSDVGRYVVASAKGLIASNIAPSAKHFPGHGNTHVDSHLGLPKIFKGKEDIQKNELVPFHMLLDEYSKHSDSPLTIMTGHMALPLITGTDEPSSLSKIITTDLLRKELDFQGVVVTDCLEMDAIAKPECGGCGIEEGSVRALEAGADVVMICHTMERQVSSIEKIYAEIESGRLNLEDLQNSSARIHALKDRYLKNWECVIGDLKDPDFAGKWEKAREEGEEIASDGYSRSTTILNEGLPGNLPLRSDPTSISLLFTPEIESLNKAVDDADGVLRGKDGNIRNTAGAFFLALRDSVSKRTKCVHRVYTKEKTHDAVDWSQVSNLVFVLRNGNTSPWQLQVMKQTLAAASLHKVSVVILSSCTPYDLVGVREANEYPCLATFEFTAPAFEAAARVMFGEAVARGCHQSGTTVSGQR